VGPLARVRDVVDHLVACHELKFHRYADDFQVPDVHAITNAYHSANQFSSCVNDMDARTSASMPNFTESIKNFLSSFAYRHGI